MVRDDAPTIDFLILADRAEALNGKLYLMGGGWDRLFVPDFGQAQPISIALAVMVPWNATNQQHNLAGRVETEDGQELGSWSLSFNTGRPPNLTEGQAQRVIFAFQLPVNLPGPGAYVVRARIDDVEDERARAIFYAHPVNAPRIAPPRLSS